MSKKPLRVAIVGMSGFAQNHHSALRALENEGECHVVATCDPNPARLETEQTSLDFSGRGVRIYDDYLTMLDAHREELNMVCVPTPVPLHAPMHRACIERGLACYLEKPPTLFWKELEAMIEVDKSAPYATQVGFNFIIEDLRQQLKQRLLNGEFGRLQRAGFEGHWPRATKYFERASWAGKLRLGHHLVLDSCTGNALSHYVHNLLFWCGRGEVLSWGEVLEVEAELYRAHAIESFDTAFARGMCKSDSGTVEIRVAATHAGRGRSWQREWFECENATISYLMNEGYSIHWGDGRDEECSASADGTKSSLTDNLRFYLQYLNGAQERPLTRLEDSRPFVHLSDLMLIAAGKITTINEAHLQHTPAPSGGEEVAITGIEDMIQSFAGDGRFPGETGVAWGRRGGRATAGDLESLEAVVARMQSEATR
jgi:predicted dehydrogenase